jgi:hypothetical protein
MTDAISPEQNAAFIKNLTDLLQDAKDDDTLGVLSQGFFFARALARFFNEAEDPHATKAAMNEDWLIAITPQVPALSGIALRHGSFPTILLFADGSFIRTGDYDEVLLDEVSGSFEDPAFETIDDNEELQFLAATQGFTPDHGPLDAWAANRPSDLPDGFYSNAIDTILEAIEYDNDPLIDGMNMKGEESWSAEQATALEEIITDAYLALNIHPDCNIDVFSSCEETESDGDIQIWAGKSHEISEQILTPYCALVLTLVDLDAFDGFEWEYNDGAGDRLSGYSQYPRRVCGFEFSYGDHSQHERLRAITRMTARLTEKGIAPDKIEQLLTQIKIAEAA